MFRELVHTFQRGVEGAATSADDQVANEGNEEDGLMAVLEAVFHAPEREHDEEDVRDGIDDLGGVDGRIVVLFAPV